MRPRRSTALLAAATAAVLVVAAAPAAHAGKPGKWTTISGPGVVNISEPGMFRTADGVVHVAIQSTTNNLDSIDVAHVDTKGTLTGRSPAVPGWEGTTEDPDLLPAPGGGMRMVFGGHRTLVSGDPYNEGYTYWASSDASGAAWTLGPNTQPAVASPQGYASYGTGTTQLADGTLVTAFPLNSTITYQVGNNAPQSFEVPDCCAYDMTLVNDGGTVYAAWYANGDLPEQRGVFVRTLYPALGPVMQAPASVTGGDSLDTGQAVAMVARAGGGVYLAYLKGYPTASAVALWKVGAAKPKLVKKTKGADNVAMSAGPGGRLWLAFDDGDDNVGVVHTNPAGTKFGALQRIKTPKNSTVYGVNIEGSGGRGDVIFNNGSAILHQQVLYGLSVKASPKKIKAGQVGKVTFKVTDAGEAVKGAKVKAKGLACTTDKKGTCSITFPRLPAQSFDVVAKEKGYAHGYARVKVKR
jgi:hypothetical protein